MQAIKTMELVKQYKKLTAVDRLHLEIRQGELFSLLGINGAGKTTTIKMLSCLTKPTAGDALVGGYSIKKQPDRVRQCIGVSPQETAIAPHLSVLENLELIGGIHGFSKEKAEKKKDSPLPIIISAIFSTLLLYISMGQMIFGNIPLPDFINMEANPYNFAITQLLLCLPALFFGRKFFTKGIPLLLKNLEGVEMRGEERNTDLWR